MHYFALYGLTYPVHTSKQKFIDYMDLLLINDKKNHTMSIPKTLTNLCSIMQNIKIKNTFSDIIYNVLVVKEFWQNIKNLFENKW